MVNLIIKFMKISFSAYGVVLYGRMGVVYSNVGRVDEAKNNKVTKVLRSKIVAKDV